MDKIRLVLFDLPALVADMVREIVSTQPDIEVVSSDDSTRNLLERVRNRSADVVIARVQTPALPDELRHLLMAVPLVKVLGIEIAIGVVHAYEMRPHHSRLGDITPEQMLVAIRSAAGRVS